MIDLWEPLKAHFLSLKRPPRILMDFFKSDESPVIVAFLHSGLLFVWKTNTTFARDNCIVPATNGNSWIIQV